MAPDAGPLEEEVREEFAYFMIRLRRSSAENASGVAGVVERLGAGEKREFRDSAELIRTLEAWPVEAGGPQAGRDQHGSLSSAATTNVPSNNASQRSKGRDE